MLTWLFCYPIADLLPGMYIDVTAPWIAFLFDSIIRDRLMARRIKQGKWLDIKLS